MTPRFLCFDGWPDDIGMTRVFVRPSQVAAVVETNVAGRGGPEKVALITLRSGKQFTVRDQERTVVNQLGEKVPRGDDP